MDFHLASQCMFKEMRTKRCMEFEAGRSPHLMTENQLQWLIKDVTDAYDVVAQDMSMSIQEWLAMISVKIYYIFVAISKETPEKVVMQDFPTISTKPRDRNVKVPPIAIDAGSTEVKFLL